MYVERARLEGYFDVAPSRTRDGDARDATLGRATGRAGPGAPRGDGSGAVNRNVPV